MDIVRITEIVYLTNGSDSVIDATKFPIVIKIPVQATNVVVIQSPKNSAIETEGDKIRLKAKLPLGHSQIVFRYDFVSDGSDISFTHTLLPQLETQELVILQSGVSVDFKRDSNIIVTEQTKEFNNQLYLSKTLSLPAGKKTLKLTLTGFPISQQKMVIPAIILGISLFSGLGLHVLKKRS